MSKPRVRCAATDVKTLDTFTQAYIEAMFWTEDEEMKGRTIYDLSAVSLVNIKDACEKFQREHGPLLDATGDAGQNGHDLWLSRNGHGAGYFDRGYGFTGERLQDHARALGNANVYQYRGIVHHD